jgi:hypothetical protein
VPLQQGVVTVTFQVPATAVLILAVICVALFTVKLFTVAPAPKLTAVAPLKLVPVMVTLSVCP